MAPKRPARVANPPVPSSEDEEEEEEEISSGEDEQIQKTQKRESQTPKAAVKEKAKSESESESESETESEDANVTPIASSKPMDEETPSKSIKPRSKTSTSTVISGKGTAKRGSEVERDAKDSKRAKTKEDSQSNGAFVKSMDTKKHLFQRVWSEDDEVVLLNGMIDFTQEKGVDPTKDMNAYYDFIKKSLHFDVPLKNFRDKIWKLKKKFENHEKIVEKGRKTLSKLHDQTVFDLSKKLWGRGGICGTSRPSNMKIESGVGVEEGEKVEKIEKEMENHVSSEEIPKLYRGVVVSTMEDFVIKRGLDMFEGTKKSEMEEKWAKLHMVELELFVKRTELILEQAKLLLAGYKSV